MGEIYFELGESPIHRLDPRIKVVTAFFISIAGALSQNLIIIPWYLLVGIFLCGLARLSFRQVMARLRPLLWFLVMIWIFLPLTFTQDILVQYGWFHISLDGVRLAARITLKSAAILLTFTALITTMPVSALGSALHRLQVPEKMVFMLLMTYRYIAVIRDEYRRLLRAARFRGFVPVTNIHSYQTYAYLAGMLFVRASHRARRVYQAMLCRGFSGRFHTLDVSRPYGLNSVFFCTAAGAGILLILIERVWLAQ